MTHHNQRKGWPSLAQLWGIATVTLLMLRVLTTPVAPNDFWWHIATGRLIAASGSIPTVDQFSYTQYGTPYYNQPWLAQLLMYGGYQLGGVELLIVLQAIVIGVSFAVLYRVCRREGAGPRLAAVLTLAGALVAMDNWQIRPQTYAVPLFIATLAILLQWRRNGITPLWMLPLIMIIWVNLHGTFTLLPALCGTIWLGAVVERRWWRGERTGREFTVLAGWSITALLASMLNPRGAAIYTYVAGLLGDRAVAELVTEWASPFRDADSPMTIVFFVLLAVFALVIALRWRRLTPAAALLLLPFLALALQSVRNILWFGIVAVPVATWLLAAPEHASHRRTVEIVALNRAIAGLLIALLIATLPWWKESLGLPQSLGNVLSANTPIAATEQLRALPQQPARLFHEMGFGSYLIWAAPDQPVFIDPRIELYSYEQWRDYITLGQGQEVEELTVKYKFDGWLLDPDKQAALVAALDADPRWQRIITTDAAVYFE